MLIPSMSFSQYYFLEQKYQLFFCHSIKNNLDKEHESLYEWSVLWKVPIGVDQNMAAPF